MRKPNISKAWIGRSVLFVAWNGQTYNAIVADLRHGFVVLQYQLNACSPFYTAYLPRKDWKRVQLRFFPAVINSNAEPA